MATYSLPYQFTAGTKASADEVNANFSYLADILEGMNAARYPFCVNSGNKDSLGNEDLFSYTGAKVTTKIGGNYDTVLYTTGAGVPTSITSSTSLTLTSASYASIVPTMSSTVSGTVTCSTNSEASGHESWRAFDKSEDSYWGSFIGVTTAELAISFNERHLVRGYYLKVLAPAEWTLEGSNDETSWTVLDSYSVAEASTVLRMLDNIGNYNVFRLSINAINDEMQIKIAEFDLYVKDANGDLKVPETQILYLGSSGLEAASGKFFRQKTKPAGKAMYEAVIPAMSSNLVPDGYIISASSFTSVNPPYYATDRSEESYWEANSNSSDVWFQVQLPNAIAAKVCKITLGNHDEALNEVLLNGTLSASNNGATWTTLCTLKDLTWNHNNESKYLYFVDNKTKYSYYRLTGESPFGSLAEFQLFVQSDDGEYLLGEADVGDVWFNISEPYAAQIYLDTNTWEAYDLVPAGEADLDSSGQIIEVRTYPYDQNGFNINANATKDSAGNVVTYDSYVSHFGEAGYVTLPNGLIMQWGSATSGESVIFPAVFPHKVFSVTANAISETGVACTMSKVSTTGFTLINGRSSSAVDNVTSYWFAVGW